MAGIIKFGVLIGLRSAEIIESVKLINDKVAFPKYYDFKTMTLSHHKFKEQFLRVTKKAFISRNSSNACFSSESKPCSSYNAIRLATRKRGLMCDMRFARKIHAMHLYQSGIPVEIIDALQGRMPASIFPKHYYKPSLDYRTKVLDALEKLKEEIE